MGRIGYYLARNNFRNGTASNVMADEGRYIPLEELDEETRREVIKTRRVIKLVGLISVSLIVLMAVFTFIAVLLAYGD